MADNNASAMINGKPINVQANSNAAATCTAGGAAGNVNAMAKKLDNCAAGKGGSSGLGSDAANDIRNAAAD